MENVDLGDKSTLINLVYGPPKDNSTISTTASVNEPMVASNGTNGTTIKPKREKVKSRAACSFCCVFYLLVFALIAVAFASFATYWITMQNYEKQLAAFHYSPQERRNGSKLYAENSIKYEEEEPRLGPTLEELKLPKAVLPVWYNVTIKSFLPGFNVSQENSNKTDGNSLIKLKIVENTKQITMNAHKIDIDSDLSNIKLFSEERSNRIKRNMGNQSEEQLEDTLNENNSTLISTIAAEITSTTEKPIAESIDKLFPADQKIVKITFNETLQQVTFELSSELLEGEEVILKVPFSLENNQLLSTYKIKSGEDRYLFQTPSIRQLFPCFDDSQAIWKIKVIHPKGTTVVGNTDTEMKNESGDWVETSLWETSSLSPNEVAFTVSDFVNIETKTKGGRKVRIWTRTESVNSPKFVADVVVKTIDYLENQYEAPFASEKCDILLHPTSSEVVVSPGFIVLPDVFDDSPKTSIATQVDSTKDLIKAVIKQYLQSLPSLTGNSSGLVDALVEHTYYNALEQIFEGQPLNARDIESIELFENILSEDTRSTSHPIVFPIHNIEDKYLQTDSISTKKSAAVLRMLRQVMGEESFTNGLKSYLKDENPMTKSSYEELWAHLSKAAPESLKSWKGEPFDVADFADKWMVQMGHPVIDVYRIDKETVEITQRRFKIDNLTPEKAKYRNAEYWYKWDIPLTIEINGEPGEVNWLHEAYRVPLNLSDTLLINTKLLGLYRINYDEMGWNTIYNQLKEDHTIYSAETRGRILSDAFALSKAGQMEYEMLWNITEYISKETEYYPTMVALNGLHHIYKLVRDSEKEEVIRQLLLSRISPLFTAVEESDSASSKATEHSEIKRRLAVINFFCKLDPITCKKSPIFGRKMFEKCKDVNYTSECSRVPILLRNEIYCRTMKNGDEETFEKAYNFTKMEVLPIERKRLICAMSCTRNPHQLRRLLRESTDNSTAVLTISDLPLIVECMAANPVGKMILSERLFDDWKNIYELLKDDESLLRRVVTSSLRIESLHSIEEVESFLSHHKFSTENLGEFKSSLELARTSISWKQREKSLGIE